MFINIRLYTDVVSYKILNVNGNKGTAVPVKKGSNGDIITCGSPFDIVFRGGIWGRWCNCNYVIRGVSDGVLEKYLENKDPNCSYEVTKDEHGTNTIVIIELTAKGKAKRQFEKLGQIEEKCRYFYDKKF